jgi:hypothetical protein
MTVRLAMRHPPSAGLGTGRLGRVSTLLRTCRPGCRCRYATPPSASGRRGGWAEFDCIVHLPPGCLSRYADPTQRGSGPQGGWVGGGGRWCALAASSARPPGPAPAAWIRASEGGLGGECPVDLPPRAFLCGAGRVRCGLRRPGRLRVLQGAASAVSRPWGLRGARADACALRPAGLASASRAARTV